MDYRYSTPIGVFWIKKISQARYDVTVNDIFLGTYPSVEKAAADVASGETGWDEWDTSQTIARPEDISRWEMIDT